MKRSDCAVLVVIAVVLGFFMLVPGAFATFKSVSVAHGFFMSFVKFAILATFGECLALRIVAGVYSRPGFGVVPRMLVWGVLGMLIKSAFTIFTTGVPVLLAHVGFSGTGTSLVATVMSAFMVSTALNLLFAPVMMTIHKITDMHITRTNGTLGGFFSSIDIAMLLKQLDWSVMWHFVFKKTIPFFWIPAHTVTFMLPGEFQVLFAAFLGIMLGLILAFAGSRKPLNPLASTSV
ncbi:hypothetical protein GO013_02050 [Pseudodesulfovibrio sp. JC047]|uniref:hypothetical protein n=1 Tax=Pseudodesulfovibrio sp. JC047 TaxID=2683199 RepID=UPI0013D488C8|nr:hypothetical protein [Pseudodesulfovibrio sp. JC047]NDV18200.1 hypothetical protein [Pseudodesulfovibrio sp. JC047]